MFRDVGPGIALKGLTGLATALASQDMEERIAHMLALLPTTCFVIMQVLRLIQEDNVYFC